MRIDALAGRYVMYRTQYRNFGTHETIVFNHTVDAGGQRAGVRWYEIRDPGGAPVIHQQSTYAPDDGVNRWMGSAAMDRQGNLAIGFSVSSSMVYPGIHYAGRLTTDPLGELTQGEAVMQLGGGSQLSAGSRWGDYSMMAVDPTDDCTFWYTTEYYAVTSSNGWQTRIGRFRFPGCRPEPDFALSANPEFLEIPQGGSDTSTITVASLNDFAGDVNVTCEGQQPGVTCSFRPNPVTVLAGSSATSILTLSVAPEVPVGDDSVMVKGTDAAGNMRMVAIDYRVTPGITPSFDITCTPSSFPVFFGVSAGVSQCRIASQGGFQGFVDLSCSGAGVTCLFLPDPVRVPAGGVGTGGLVMIAFGVQPGDVFHVVGRSGTLTDTFTMTFRRP